MDYTFDEMRRGLVRGWSELGARHRRLLARLQQAVLRRPPPAAADVLRSGAAIRPRDRLDVHAAPSVSHRAVPARYWQTNINGRSRHAAARNGARVARPAGMSYKPVSGLDCFV